MRNRLKFLPITQTGDTIVEVLICIAVISLVMISTYVTVNDSYLSFEDTQERIRAVKLAETQIEALRSWSKTTGNYTLSAGQDCFMYNGSTVTLSTNSGSVPANPCIQSSTGAQILSASTVPAYNVHILPNTPTTNTFKVDIQWQGLHQPKDDYLEYRLQ